ncbi:uncharacterized protein LOC126327318 isoform X2 [Schistocerca gregaria]|nr:uncharacterized protein LOC126327318 isoform X2 [Schistocerca gregaria]
MEGDTATELAPISKNTGTAARQFYAQRENLLATRRLRRRRQKRQAPFKMCSEGTLSLISSSAGGDGSIDDNSKNGMECSTSPVDNIIGQSNLKALLDIKGNSGGEDIITVINSCLEVVLTLSSDLRTVAKHLFGSYVHLDYVAEEAGSTNRAGDLDQKLEMAKGCVSGDSYERRLETLLTYLSKEEPNADEQVSTDFSCVSAHRPEGWEDRKRHVGEKVASSSQIRSSSAKQEAASIFNNTIATHNEQFAASTMASKGSAKSYHGTSGNAEIQRNTGSSQQVSLTAKSYDHTMASDGVTAQTNVPEVNGSCRVMLHCMKSMVQILYLALEANRLVQQAVKWATTREYEFAESIATVVLDTAGMTAQSASSALSEAENAVLIYEQLVRGFTAGDRSFNSSQVTEGKDNIRADAAAAAAGDDQVQKLVQQTSNIHLNQMDQDSTVVRTNIVQSRARNNSSNGQVSSSDEIPCEASQTLLRATQSSLCAVDAALTVLEILSVAQ